MKTYCPPADKSITIRALLFGAIAAGNSRVENPLICADTEAALACLEALGVRHSPDGNAILIEGRGLNGLKMPAGPLDAGESGALARLLAGLLAAQPFPSVLSGRGTLLGRPMAGTADALTKIGARINTAGGFLPFTLKPALIKGGSVSGVTSAQVKSALLLAGLYAVRPVQIRQAAATRDHSERLLSLLGARLTTDGKRLILEAGPLTARPVTVPGDISSAAPFIAAALLAGTPLRVTGCGLNPLRLGFIAALRRMGAKINIKTDRGFPEPAGEIEVLPSKLKAVKIKPAEITAMIDEVPLLAVLAGAAKGNTVIGGAGALRGKESDRVESTLALLAALGVKAACKSGSLTVTGAKKFSAKAAADTFDDHRIAMAAAAARAACPGLKIRNPGCVNKSYPGFWKDFRKVFSFSS
ncbi:MAG: 3-phosphoshikimate 1-carboxyvinyltransferase [Elusimicrobia bacterium HGW-Elusimicrobia-3]|nr:MAG: 3-phosphoshikimate 1-carboxyvinyltransferase [Elusimicrobia bacterium HGW-Elusimicrobia-3]